MKKFFPALACAALATALCVPLAAHAADNIATVNGKAVPKARVDYLKKQLTEQAAAQGKTLPPDVDQRMSDNVVMGEILAQEAQRRGLVPNPEARTQMEQNLLIQALIDDYERKNQVTDAEVQAEYDKFKAQSQGGGMQYRARHILVKTEAEAKTLIKQIKGGAKFDELAKKKSTDTGSGANGGDLDFADPNSYVPEFSKALVALKKGQMTDTPVQSQFGYHIIKLEDTREPPFPKLDEVKPQIQQGLSQKKREAFLMDLRTKAKTDYKFSPAQ
jgi:peptidyl-prolyl cis-trans isomerase C